MVVLDASVTLAWHFQDDDSAYAETVLRAVNQQGSVGLVPALWQLEVVNSLLVAERRMRFSQEQTELFFRVIQDVPVDIEGPPDLFTLERIMTLARRRGLTAYDAAYLELAARRGAPLATLDKTLRRAARAEKVAVFKA